MFRQLWIVPVNKMGLFFSKFFVILLYSMSFMLLNAAAPLYSLESFLDISLFPGLTLCFWWNVVLENAVLIGISMLPVLALSALQKGYLFPACMILLYLFAGFFMTSACPYFHPISCTSILIARNGIIPGLTLPSKFLPAFLGILVWSLGSIAFASLALRKRKKGEHMKTLLWAELQKLPPLQHSLCYYFCSLFVAILVFSGGVVMVSEEQYALNRTGWYLSTAQVWATLFVLPAMLALFGSYLICREEQDDTMKSLLLIPVSVRGS